MLPLRRRAAAASARTRAGSRSSAPAWSTRTSSAMAGLRPREWPGFAFGMGIERIAMLRHGFHDLRTLLRQRPAVPGAVPLVKVPVSWLRDYVAFDAAARRARASGSCCPGSRSTASRARGAPDAGRQPRQLPHRPRGRVRQAPERRPAAAVPGRRGGGRAAPDRLRRLRTSSPATRSSSRCPGARLPGAASRCERAKLRGEVSDGMMLSERELQLSDEHAGIIPAATCYEIGDAARVRDFALDEVVLDLEVLVEPRRPALRLRHRARGLDAVRHRPRAAAGRRARGDRLAADVGRRARRHRRPRPLPALHGARVQRRAQSAPSPLLAAASASRRRACARSRTSSTSPTT